MQNEITVSPLVDILSKQLSREVVMSGSKYVYLDTKEEIVQSEVDVALVSQDAELLEQAKASLEVLVQNHLDSQAQSLGYDGIVSACSYAGYANEFQDEAVALGVWRSVVWTKAYQVQADVEAGTLPMPTEDELIAMLPVYGA